MFPWQLTGKRMVAYVTFTWLVIVKMKNANSEKLNFNNGPEFDCVKTHTAHFSYTFSGVCSRSENVASLKNAGSGWWCVELWGCINTFFLEALYNVIYMTVFPLCCIHCFPWRSVVVLCMLHTAPPPPPTPSTSTQGFINFAWTLNTGPSQTTAALLHQGQAGWWIW